MKRFSFKIALRWFNFRKPLASETVELRVWDTLGQEATKTFRVNIDYDAPALKVLPAPRALVRRQLVATDSTAGYSFIVDPAKYGKIFTVQLRTYDRAGNFAYSSARTYRRL